MLKKTAGLFEHEVDVAVSKKQKPKNAYQAVFSRWQCEAYETDERIVYFLPTTRFETFRRKSLPKILCDNPTIFKEKDACEIMDMLYEASNYKSWHRTKYEYCHLIAEETCAYVVIQHNGQLENRLLRIDFFRLIQYNQTIKKNEFVGGLFHEMNHFSFTGANEGDSLRSINHLIGIIINAFCQLPDKCQEDTIDMLLPEVNGKPLRLILYQELKNEVFYIKSLYFDTSQKSI